MDTLFFVGGARDYHAFDWYRTVKEICAKKRVVFITDLISSEGYEKLVDESDEVIELFNIDRFLLSKQSRYGNLWRNFVKLFFFPVQAWRLRTIARNNPDAVFHAHTMYYMFLCWIAHIRYIGTTQGSEILVRTKRSKLYRYFAVKSLRAAQHLIIDSVSMQQQIMELSGKESTVIQNGIDVDAISRVIAAPRERENVVSIRGFTPLYRINEIFDGRDHSVQKPRLHFIYPFSEDVYKARVSKRLEEGDVDLGRISRTKMYELLAGTKLAVSIPVSDSSPRSVYEAVFCGCCVAVTYHRWIDVLPDCMRARLILVNLEDESWFGNALQFADSVSPVPYVPTEAALDMFDQRRTMKVVADRFY